MLPQLTHLPSSPLSYSWGLLRAKRMGVAESLHSVPPYWSPVPSSLFLMEASCWQIGGRLCLPTFLPQQGSGWLSEAVSSNCEFAPSVHSVSQRNPGISIETVASQAPGHEMVAPSEPTLLLPSLALALPSAQPQPQPSLVECRDRRLEIFLHC